MAATVPAHREEVGKLDKDDKILAHFWNLASLEAEVQFRASSDLVDAVLKTQSSAPKAGKREDGEAVVAAYSPTTGYTLKRLVKGLASGNAGARQGFALALTLLLKRLPGMTADDAVLLLASYLEAPSASKGAETRDYLLGRTFGIGAIVQARVPASTACKAEMIDQLLDAGVLKSFLREAAATVILDLVASETEESVSALLSACAPLSAALSASIDQSTPEMLVIALGLWPILPAAVVEASPLLPSGAPRPAPGYQTGAATAAASAAFFAAPHLTTLVPLLTFTTANHPALHSLWTTLLAFLCPGEGSVIADAALEALWMRVVEPELVGSGSHARKYLSITLFLRLLPHLTADNVATVLSPPFLRFLSTNVSQRKAYLHASAHRCELALVAALSGDDADLALAVSLALQRAGGSLWDRVRAGAKSAGAAAPGGKANAITGVQSLDAAQLAELVERQVAVISSACGALTLDDEEAGEEGAPPLEAPAAATAALESLWAAVKQESATEESRQAVFRLLAALAFLEPGQEAPTPQPTRGSRAKAAAKPGMEDPTMQTLRAAGARGAALRPLAAARLIALADFLAKRPVAPGSAAPSPPLADLVAWVEGALSSGHARLARVGAGALSSTQPLREALSRATASADAGGRGRVAALTHLALLLQLYEWADPSVVDPGVGPDLADVVDRALCQAGAEVDGPRAGVNGDAAPAWHDTLVDVVLSLLARPCSPMPSAPLRNAAESVFRVFATDLTTTGLQDLLRVLASLAGGPEEVLGEGEGSEQEDDEGSEEEEEEEEGSEAEEGSEESEAEAASSSDEEVDAEAGAASPSGQGNDSDDGLGATDAEMFRMDAKLAAYFATIKNGKGGNAKAAAEQLDQFKLRVVTLLEYFLKRSPASPLVPTAAVPMLNALAVAAKPSGSQVLSQRLAGLINSKLVKTKPGAAGVSAFEPEDLAAALKRSLYLASRSADPVVESAARAVYTFLQRAAAGQHSAGDGARAVAALESAQAAARDVLASRRTRLDRAFFANLLGRVPTLAPHLLPGLLRGCSGARSEFVRAEAVALTQLALGTGQAGVAGVLGDRVADVQALLLSACDRGVFAKPARQAEAARLAARMAATLLPVQGRAGPAGLDWGAVRAAAGAAAAAAAAAESQKAAAAYQALLEAIPESAAGAAAGAPKPRKRAKKA
ncbi:hypothetical protein ACKKBG_A30985 [Auxenochlorella protothecoides x Auxenochlorella symbiontica]